MTSKSKDVVFLLGAGASAEAKIPTSAAMIQEIEDKILKDAQWRPHLDLYNHVRSAIHYSAGLKGQFGSAVLYNIETVVNTLYELERNEEHPLYPFIAAWNSRFAQLAGEKFCNVQEFRRLILTTLKDWMCPADPSDADYYKGFIKIQAGLNFPLQIFSLNYDRCVEQLASTEFVVETGFPGFGPKNVWTFERFLETERGSNPLPQIFLYKLHGSIDWVRDENTKELTRVDQVQRVKADQMEIIFGREFKLEAADPYLFYAYQFRQFALDAKLIVVIGYGFGDPHINKMLTQALRSEGPKRLVVVSRADDDAVATRRGTEIGKLLEIPSDSIVVLRGTASSILREEKLAEQLIALVPVSDSAPF